MTYWISKYFSYLFFKVFYRLKVRGRENLPPRGGYILAPNHNSLIDPPLAAAAVGDPLYFMAKKELFEIPLFSSFIRSAHAFPVRRGGVDKNSIKRAIKILKKGGALLLFPEGGRRESGSALRGVSYLAAKTGAPVVPAGIVNNTRVHLFRRIYFNIGRPLPFFSPPGKKASGKEYDKFAGRVLKEIYTLKENG